MQIKSVSKIYILRLCVLAFIGLFGVCRSHADIASGLELSGMSFLSSDYDRTDTKAFNFIGAHLKSYQSEHDIFKIDLHGAYSAGNAVLSYINIKELYFTFDIDYSSSVHVGRKLMNWSDADQRWNLGMFQPQFRWNPLDVENQGVFGVFYEKRSNNVTFSLFGSTVHIPDQGPGYELKNGKFEASNPYFTPPPQNIYFQDVLLPIDYNIHEPEFSEVVFQPSFGIQLKYSDLSTGLYTALSGAYKPAGQFAMGYQGILVTDRVRIDIKPKSYYEKLINLDLGYNGDWGNTGLSVLYNDSENAKFESGYNYPIFKPTVTTAPYVKLFMNPFDVELSFLFNSNAEVKELGPEASDKRQSLTQKFLYENAYQVQLNYKSLLTKDLLYRSNLQWRAAEGTLLQILKWKNTLDVRGPWKFTFDVLLVETSDEVSAVSNYRNLDQAWLGVIYDF
ncbi:MAG: hypothetical protein ACK41T_02695 [Pseudobdellovibrio sp.]